MTQLEPCPFCGRQLVPEFGHHISVECDCGAGMSETDQDGDADTKWNRRTVPTVEKCTFACPHGDRCTLNVGHEGGHNHGACDCNEPDSPMPKTWHELELRREYLRGLLYAWSCMCSPDDAANAATEAARLEAVKPCTTCGGDGFVFQGALIIICAPCNGMGIVPTSTDETTGPLICVSP